jgi:hypothetical protein
MPRAFDDMPIASELEVRQGIPKVPTDGLCLQRLCKKALNALSWYDKRE